MATITVTMEQNQIIMSQLSTVSEFDGKFDDLERFIIQTEQVVNLFTKWKIPEQHHFLNTLYTSKLKGRAFELFQETVHADWKSIKEYFKIHIKADKK